MSNNLQFGAELKIGTDSTVSAEQRIQALRAATVELATGFDKGEISQQEFSAALKGLNSEIRANEAAVRIRAAAQDEAAQAAERAIGAEREWVQAMGASARAARDKAEALVQGDLEEQLERETLALQHQIEMLEHDERQTREAIAAHGALNDAIAREVTAFEQSQRELAQKSAGLNQLSAAEARAKEATDRETASVWAEISAMESGEREALQFANAMFADEAAATGFAQRMRVADEVTGNFTTVASAAAGSAGKLRGGMGSLQQSITAGSYAFQDFTATSGDLGAKLNSISNNLPTLLIGLGGLGTVISVAATAGIALYRNWDSIAAFWETRNPFPKGAEDVAGMKRELDRAKESLEKMEKAGSGNADQIAKYNDLRADTARIEKEIADQTERQNILKKARSDVSEDQEGRAKGFAEATKGTGFEGKLTEAYRHDLEGEIESARVQMELRVQTIKASGALEEEKQKQVYAERLKFDETVRVIRNNDPAKLAENLYLRLLKGEESALAPLQRLSDQMGGSFDAMIVQMRNKNPEIKKKVDAAFDLAMKELEATEKELAEHEKQRVRMWWADIDEGIKALSKDTKAEAKALTVDAKAEASAEKKGQNQEARDEKSDLEASIRTVDAQQKAEANRIIGVVGKDSAKARIEEQSRENPGANPEQIAARIAAQFAVIFERSVQQGGLGATRGGANVAARQLVGNAGFSVGEQQLFESRNLLAPTARPVAARTRPKPGKTPPPKATAAPKAKPLARSQNEVDTARIRAIQAKFAKPPTPKPKAPGVAELARPIAGTQQAVAKIAADQAKDRQIIAQLNARVRSLTNRAQEMTVTALNSGSSTS